MRAVVHERYGAPLEVLEVTEVGEPTPGPQEVLVAASRAERCHPAVARRWRDLCSRAVPCHPGARLV
ncbi:MAG TPA: hypothetical protein VK969_09020, partial [Acidimicrobiia bacterium]|nr:hypothetical protein [Acidimicrobiia bacterium]